MKYPKQKQKRNLSEFKSIDLIEGETIEDKCKRLIESKEPITDGAPILFTERKDGVLPAYDIRTDRWAIAQEAMDKNRKAIDAKRKADYDLMLNGKEKDVKADKSAETNNSAEANNNGGSAA
jgi:hypothetical protein